MTATLNQPSNQTVHGDPERSELRALGLDVDGILDFSVCVNPYGPPPGVRAAIRDVPLHQYPDRQAAELRHRLADWLHVDPECILVGNGESELIWLTALAFLRPQTPVLIPEPSYGEYRRSTLMVTAAIVPLLTREADRFHLDPDRVLHELQAHQPGLCFLGNPCNPTGSAIDPQEIVACARQTPDTLFAVDEAYLPFTDLTSVLDHLPPRNILVLRSMTKDFALAGLRLGFAVGSPEVIDQLARMQPPWSVNSMAQAAGVAALEDVDHALRTCKLLRDDSRKLIKELRALGLDALDSAGHYFLMKVGCGAEFRRRLLRCGILVRDGASFGLPEFVRIAARLPEENRRLVDAIKEVLR